MVLQKTLESPLDNKKIKIVNPKGNQPWIFTGRTDAKAEAPTLWPPDVKNWLLGKDPDAGKDWRQEKGITEDKMIGWHHQLDGHEFEQTLGDSERQGSLMCCSPWSHKESDTTEWLDNKKQQLPGGRKTPTFSHSTLFVLRKSGEGTEKHLWRSQPWDTGP